MSAPLSTTRRETHQPPPLTASSTTSTETAPSIGRIRTGSTEFRCMLVLMIATTALGIDIMLASFDEIGTAFGLPDESNRLPSIITVFFLGIALGQIPAGLLADRFGRKPVLIAGLSLVIAMSGAIPFMSSFTTLLIARFLWGLGGGAVRVTASALVRDSLSGEAMAREMSLVMGVFMLVPVLAPSLGAALTRTFDWRVGFWACTTMALVLLVWSSRLGESLPADRRRPISFGSITDAARTMSRSRQTMGYLVGSTLMFLAFSSYISSSPLIIDETLGYKNHFPLIFGAMAALMSVATFSNGRLLTRFGLTGLIRRGMIGYLTGATIVLVVAIVTKGKPPLWLWMPCISIVACSFGSLQPNMNAAALKPMGALAGTASAVIGTAIMGFGSVGGNVVNGRFDGTVRPLSIAFFVCGVFALFAVRWAGHEH